MGCDGTRVPTLSVGRENGPVEVDNGMHTGREGLETNSPVGKMERLEFPFLESEQGEPQPSEAEELEETGRESPTGPNTGTLH